MPVTFLLINPAWVSVSFSVGSPILIALFFWGKKQLAAGQNQLTGQMLALDKKVDAISKTQDDHAALDAAQFSNHGERLSWVEGAVAALGVEKRPRGKVGIPALEPLEDKP